MARAVYDFQSPNKKTTIGKRRETMSKEIIQFDDAMFESKLDVMIKTKVEDIVNSILPGARCQRCMVHFIRNVLSKVPPSHREWASATPYLNIIRYC